MTDLLWELDQSAEADMKRVHAALWLMNNWPKDDGAENFLAMCEQIFQDASIAADRLEQAMKTGNVLEFSSVRAPAA